MASAKMPVTTALNGLNSHPCLQRREQAALDNRIVLKRDGEVV